VVRSSSGTPQLSSSIPGGNEFRSGVKKNPLAPPNSSKHGGTRPSQGTVRCAELDSPGNRVLCTGWEGGSGVFSTCVRRLSSSFTNAVGRLGPTGRVLFIGLEDFVCHCTIKISQISCHGSGCICYIQSLTSMFFLKFFPKNISFFIADTKFSYCC